MMKVWRKTDYVLIAMVWVVSIAQSVYRHLPIFGALLALCIMMTCEGGATWVALFAFCWFGFRIDWRIREAERGRDIWIG